MLAHRRRRRRRSTATAIPPRTIASDQLERDVRRRPQRGEAQLAAPPGRPFDRDHGAAAGAGEHRSVDRHADHARTRRRCRSRPAGRNRCPTPNSRKNTAGHHEGEDHGAPVAQQPAHLDAQERHLEPAEPRCRRSAARRWSSVDAPVGAAGGGERDEGVLEVARGDLEIAGGGAESAGAEPPRRCRGEVRAPCRRGPPRTRRRGQRERAVVGARQRGPDGAAGGQARTSAEVPSATTRPRRTSTTRSAYASASSR